MTEHDTYPDTRAWRAAGSPRPYRYRGPRPSQPWALQLAVIGLAVLAVIWLDSLLQLSSPGLLARYAAWHWLPGPALAAGIAAGAGVVTAVVLLQYRLLRRLVRRLRRLAKKTFGLRKRHDSCS